MSPRALFLIGVLFVPVAVPLTRGEEPPTKPLTAEQKEKLKEAARLGKEAARLFGQKKKAEGLAASRKKLGLEKEVYGPEHDTVLSSLRTLARLHEQLRDYAEAAKVRREILQALQKRLGKGHWRVTDARLAMEDVGVLQRLDPGQHKQLDQAEQLNRDVFRLWSAGRSKEALPLALKAVQIRSELLGGQHRNTAVSLLNLGAQYQVLRQWDQAEDRYRQALQIQKEVLGDKHPHYADSLRNLAALYQDQGDYAQALPVYLQARDLYKEVLGQKHLSYVNSLYIVARLYHSGAITGGPCLRTSRHGTSTRRCWGRRTPTTHDLSITWQRCTWNRGITLRLSPCC